MKKALSLNLKKDATVSLKQQLLTQLMMQITSGQLLPGTVLPSIRQMATRLGIHYNTCLGVYEELEAIGLVVKMRGSGTRVADWKATPELKSMMASYSVEAVAKQLVTLAMQEGVSRSTLLSMVEDAYLNATTQRQPRVVFVDKHADILPLFHHELCQTLQQPVQCITLDELDNPSVPFALNDTIDWVVSHYHVNALLQWLQHQYETPPRVHVLRVSSGVTELERINALKPNSLVLLYSASTILLQQAEARIQALRGDSLLLSIRQPSDDPDEVMEVARHAKLILTDALQAPWLNTITKSPVMVMHLLPEDEKDALRSWVFS